MYVRMKDLILWLDQKQQLSMPMKFYFGVNLLIVIDCFRHFHGATIKFTGPVISIVTLKFPVGITPKVAVSFLSK